jgi:hypothetical protein
MSSNRPLHRQVHSGGPVPFELQPMLDEVRAWLDDDRDTGPGGEGELTGVIFVGLREGGFDLQYVGSEKLGVRELEDRLVWIVQQILDSVEA